MTLKHACLALALVALPFGAEAAGYTLAAGPSFTSGARVTAVVFGSVYGSAPEDGRWHFEPIGTVGWVDGRSTHKENLDHSVFLAAGGVQISKGSHWFASEQLAGTTHETDALSSHIEFMTTVGWHAGRFAVMVRHISDAHLFGKGKNLGETMLLGGIRF